MRTLTCLLVATYFVSSGQVIADSTRPLDFAQRVRAQEAIERVYYSHQLDSKRPFEEAVPRALLEKKVRTYLRQSVALERYWGVEIAQSDLTRELQRIARQTRFPDRLSEIYAALDHDPVLIMEVVARPTLVDRLVRRAFERDKSIHSDARWRADRLHDVALTGQFDGSEKLLVTLRELRRTSSSAPSHERRVRAESDGTLVISLDAEAYETQRNRIPSGVGTVGPLDDNEDRFFFDVVLQDGGDRVRFARYSVDKVRWDNWWTGVEESLDPKQVDGVATGDALELPVPGGEAAEGRALDPGCVPDGTWQNGILGPDDFLTGVSNQVNTAVWTGSLLIMWGGTNYENFGQIYDPVLDAWRPTTRVGAPAGRFSHVSVWTGTEMIVQGGYAGAVSLTSGGRYDPLTDAWVAMSEIGALRGSSAVWTGSEMLVSSGSSTVMTGARYDPASDSWTPMSEVNAPIGNRGEYSAVWTGSEMIIWGGRATNIGYLNSGGRYDPVLDQWTAMSEIGAPAGRGYAATVWSGTEMIVWGGEAYSIIDDGGAYDPASDTWRPVSGVNSPGVQSVAAAAWNGTEMLVWSSGWGEHHLVGMYNPTSDTWRLSGTPPPNVKLTSSSSGLTGHFVFWIGEELLIWYQGDGARYDPVTDDWTETFRPDASAIRPAAVGGVWTGNEYVIWGGGVEANMRNTGARYDPLLDQWTATTTTGAPSARYGHRLVWSGDEMIVWGGAPAAAGGRYDPTADTWTTVSQVGEPTDRDHASAIWAGDRMIVWGGVLQENNLPQNTQEWCEAWFPVDGASYDPILDRWTAIPGSALVEGRQWHSATWTGDRMIAYGGDTYAWVDEQTVPGEPPIWVCADVRTSRGVSYQPMGSTRWSEISNAGAPLPDTFVSAVWAGDRLIVSNHAYFPSSDSWFALSTNNAPLNRRYSLLVWTGSEVVEWSGSGPTGVTNTGGRYDLATDTWSPTPTLYAPAPLNGYSGAWTGDFMMAWGWDTGGRLFLGNPDSDGDRVADSCDVCPLDAENDADADGWCESVDNCDLSMNPLQTDTDEDGTGDVCDVCPLLANLDENDSDGDGNADACDCQPLDPSDFAPTAVGSLTIQRPDAQTASLSWTPTVGADVYSVSRGLISSLAGSAYGGCFAEGVTGTTIDDTELPPQNDAFFYLVQAQNLDCGLGDLGRSPDESPRVNLDLAACGGIAMADSFAEEELSVEGGVSGTFADTVVSDDVTQTITEIQTSGNPSTRYDLLEHRWRFTVPAGSRVEFHVEGFRTDSVDDETYIFELSTDGGASWVPIGSASLPSGDDGIDRMLPLPDTLAGSVWVRVMDSNRAVGTANLDTLSIDQIFVRSIGSD